MLRCSISPSPRRRRAFCGGALAWRRGAVGIERAVGSVGLHPAGSRRPTATLPIGPRAGLMLVFKPRGHTETRSRTAHRRCCQTLRIQCAALRRPARALARRSSDRQSRAADDGTRGRTADRRAAADTWLIAEVTPRRLTQSETGRSRVQRSASQATLHSAGVAGSFADVLDVRRTTMVPRAVAPAERSAYPGISGLWQHLEAEAPSACVRRVASRAMNVRLVQALAGNSPLYASRS